MHRDIKLDNILMRVDGTIVYIDFGFSTTKEGGTVLGAPMYRAPEIQRAKVGGKYNKKADVYSLGVVFK